MIILKRTCKKSVLGASVVAQWIKSQPVMWASNLDAGSLSPRWSASDPAPYYTWDSSGGWPNAWAHVFMGPGFGLVQPSHCGHLGYKPEVRRMISCCLSL